MENKTNAMKKLAVKFATAVLPTVALAMTYPPYDIYTGTTAGNPQLTYTKMCEPGRTGEGNASYVILGSYYPSRTAVATGYDGDVIIPSFIDGLPVRKINEAAFVACTKLRGVKIPATVREIGARAFSDCWLLTNVTFEAGVATIGDSAFSNCASLVSITFPKTISRLGAGCFQGCVSLTDVYFLGNAPRLTLPSVTDKSGLGEMIFRNYGYYERFKVHIRRNTYGWIAPYAKGVPEKWPVDYGYMQAHETVAEDGGGATGGGSAADQQSSPSYALTNAVADRAVASLTVDSDHAIDAFVLKDGKVYDTVLYISNTAGHDVKLKLPSGNTYKTFKGTNPLSIPANSTSVLTITRVAGGNAGGNVFLVSREELETLE